MPTQKTQIEKIYQTLSRNRNKPVSIQQLTSKTGLSKEAVYRRVYDLRNREGLLITNSAKTVKGEKKNFYTLISSVA